MIQDVSCCVVSPPLRFPPPFLSVAFVLCSFRKITDYFVPTRSVDFCPNASRKLSPTVPPGVRPHARSTYTLTSAALACRSSRGAPCTPAPARSSACCQRHARHGVHVTPGAKCTYRALWESPCMTPRPADSSRPPSRAAGTIVWLSRVSAQAALQPLREEWLQREERRSRLVRPGCGAHPWVGWSGSRS